MTDTDSRDDQLVVLVECRNELEGQEIRSLIESEGMTAFVFEKQTLGIGLSCSDSRLTGVEVKVPLGQRDRALAALEEARRVSAEIDWDQVDVGETLPEVTDVLENRSLVHNTRRMVTVLGPLLGLGFLVLAVVGIVLFFVP